MADLIDKFSKGLKKIGDEQQKRYKPNVERDKAVAAKDQANRRDIEKLKRESAQAGSKARADKKRAEAKK